MVSFGKKNGGDESQRDYKKAFGQFSSMQTQRISNLEPAIIHLDGQEQLAGGQSIDFDGGNIKIKQSGTYLLIAAPQIGKTDGTRNRWIDFWVRINNVDLSNSNIRRVITQPHETDVVTMNVVTDLNKDDIIQIMMAGESDSEGLGIECIEPEGEPGIPSIIVTLVQLD